MTHILVECTALIASVRVGVLQPLQPLVDAKWCDVRYVNTKDISKRDIAWCDVYISVRGGDMASRYAASIAKKMEKFLVYFLDDDLLNIPEDIEVSKYYNDPMGRKSLQDIVEFSDVLWAVNHRILEKYGLSCTRKVVSNVPAIPLKKPEVSSAGKCHILYAGSMSHTTMIQKKIAPVVMRLLKEYPDKVDFTFIGADPGIQRIKGVECFPYFDSYEDYQKKMLRGGFQIGLAPGIRTPFFSCKYYNKFIEYSTYGIVGIYDDCAPFTDIVRNGINGVLCGEDAEEWYLALKKLIDDEGRVFKMAEVAQSQLSSEFSPDTIAKKLAQDIPELIEYHSKAINPNDVKMKSMKRIYIQERFGRYWRLYGLKSFVVIPFKAVRKLCYGIRQKVSV